MGRLNVDIDDVVLEKALKNAKYTSPTIQKEILHILANKMRKKICEQVRDAKFCILVDEAKDASNKEQMAIVLRFVDIQGFVKGMMVLAICVAHGMDYKLYFSEIVLMHIMYIALLIDYNWDKLQQLKMRFLFAIGERETGRGANQIGNLHRSGTTHWSSHFDSICSLIDMYGATITVLESMVQEGSSNSIHGEVGGCLIVMKSFEFIFILYLMHKIMGITDLLCRALKQKSLDILNVMDLVSTTKALLQTLRDAGFDLLLANVQFVCTKYEIEIPHMNASYKKATVDAIYKLAEKFYPEDFNEQEMYYLRSQLKHYQIDVIHHESFQNMSTISELCRGLAETNKSQHYHLIDRLIRLVLTLPVSTATTERAFSAMKHVKTVLRNKMEEEFLADSMMIYIERELVEDIKFEFDHR
ncbi:uncharacterized protein LOC18099636 [Populus trichocarpa]|uniref:uncharacterized protein LOC18099636 n=1 Tax=Populus trichocarpa TaxID=3694 RepID=UPI002277613A|nr:uncharacterized protein LOC18099636 [Populus trichocarpa]